jgi:hypothetical protein
MGLVACPSACALAAVTPSLGASVPDILDVLNPAVGALASSVAAAFLTVGLLGLAAGLIAAYVRQGWMRAALMILCAALMATNVATPGTFFREAAFHLVAIAAFGSESLTSRDSMCWVTFY